MNAAILNELRQSKTSARPANLTLLAELRQRASGVVDMLDFEAGRQAAASSNGWH